MVSPPKIQGPEASCRNPYRTPLGPHTKEWNGGLAAKQKSMCGERMPYIHRHVVCVCVCVSEQKGNHPVPQEGGWEIEWPYIHKDMVGGCVCVCVWQKGKPSCSTGGGGGFSFLPGPHAQLENHKTAGEGGGDAAGSRAQNRGGGGRGCRRSRGMSCSTGGAGRIHHDVHYLLKYKST